MLEGIFRCLNIMYSPWFEWYFDGTLPELQRGEEVIVNRLQPSGPKIVRQKCFFKKISGIKINLFLMVIVESNYTYFLLQHFISFFCPLCLMWWPNIY